MSQSSPIKKWTTEDVHQWLMTEVKVHQSCADIFIKEDVFGEYLVLFEKKDILDLKIKHGPAVKIISYLESLKQGSKHQSQFPAYVEKWTKEQVNEWLLQHVKLYSKYAERLQEEDVSGDCLVCFSKQDLLDLDIKSGPAVKIVAELRLLNSKPEPILQPSLHISRDQKEPDPSPAQSLEVKQPESKNETESKTGKTINSESHRAPMPNEKALLKEAPKPRALGAKPKEINVVKFKYYYQVNITSMYVHFIQPGIEAL